MKKSRLIALLFALIMAAGILAACAQDEDTPAPEDIDGAATDAGAVEPDEEDAARAGQTLTVVAAAFPQSLDPQMQLDMYSAKLGTQIFDTLFEMDSDTMIVQPRLVAFYFRPDMQTLDITLRDNVRFHNGAPLTADDVRFSILRAMDSHFVGFIVEMIDDVIVHDDLSLTITTTEPFAPLTNHLAHFGISIISERIYHETGGNPEQRPIGTGAFMYVDSVLDDRIELRRFDDFWGELPDFNYINWRIIPDAANRLAEVEAGRADIALEIAPGDIDRAAASHGIVLHRRMGLGVHYLGMNLGVETFNDIRVRHAIAYALDLHTISRAAYEGAGRPGTGPLSDSIWGAHPVAQFGFNPQRARELLAEAGLPDGFSTTLWYNAEDDQYSVAARMIQSQLRDVGIGVSIQNFDRATYLELLEQGEQQMFLMSWHTLTGDADFGLYDTQSTWGWGSGNLAFSGTAEIDSLLRQGRQIGDAAQRLEIYRQAQYLIRDHAAKIYFQQTEELHVSASRVREFVVHPSGLHDLSTITLAG